MTGFKPGCKGKLSTPVYKRKIAPYQRQMAKKTISDMEVIDRIGAPALAEHFHTSRQNIYNWRVRGIPKHYRRAIVLLGESHGHDMDDFVADEAA